MKATCLVKSIGLLIETNVLSLLYTKKTGLNIHLEYFALKAFRQGFEYHSNAVCFSYLIIGAYRTISP